MNDPGSRKRLTPGAIGNYPGDNLFARLARAVCEAQCLPRKELHEAWELAKRVRRRFRGRRVVDLAAGQGLLAYVMLLLDDSSQVAVAVDKKQPANAPRLWASLEKNFPRIAGRVSYRQMDLARFELLPGDLVVAAHACGQLSDLILERAIAASVPVAIMPCCHVYDHQEKGGLEGWMAPDLAIDVVRAARLRAAGYHVHTQSLAIEITPKNRILYGHPPGEFSA